MSVVTGPRSSSLARRPWRSPGQRRAEAANRILQGGLQVPEYPAETVEQLKATGLIERPELLDRPCATSTACSPMRATLATTAVPTSHRMG
jgi:hypothetical protein